MDSFDGFELDQCISGPTHKKGLDLMLIYTVKTLPQTSKSFKIVIFVSLKGRFFIFLKKAGRL